MTSSKQAACRRGYAQQLHQLQQHQQKQNGLLLFSSASPSHDTTASEPHHRVTADPEIVDLVNQATTTTASTTILSNPNHDNEEDEVTRSFAHWNESSVQYGIDEIVL